MVLLGFFSWKILFILSIFILVKTQFLGQIGKEIGNWAVFSVDKTNFSLKNDKAAYFLFENSR